MMPAGAEVPSLIRNCPSRSTTPEYIAKLPRSIIAATVFIPDN
ncbi:hypothetical protein SAMN05428949_3478 [Chitinophaga sp. YR627]|nr:hypothetical protein SAMN05428949_3478 [Chitinophaga sp. YR627]